MDPIYEFAGEDIRRRFEETAEGIIAQVRGDEESWVWSYHRSPDDLLESRRRTLEHFLVN